MCVLMGAGRGQAEVSGCWVWMGGVDALFSGLTLGPAGLGLHCLGVGGTILLCEQKELPGDRGFEGLLRDTEPGWSSGGGP